jgi:MraZ protein
VVLTRLDQCLAAYPPQEWARLESQLAAMPAFNRQVKSLTRLLTSRAVDCELDVQGRILLPPALRKAAGIEKEATVIGVLNRFEIWPTPVWESFLSDSESLLDDLSVDLPWPLPTTPGEPSEGA